VPLVEHAVAFCVCEQLTAIQASQHVLRTVPCWQLGRACGAGISGTRVRWTKLAREVLRCRLQDAVVPRRVNVGVLSVKASRRCDRASCAREPARMRGSSARAHSTRRSSAEKNVRAKPATARSLSESKLRRARNRHGISGVPEEALQLSASASRPQSRALLRRGRRTGRTLGTVREVVLPTACDLLDVVAPS